MNRRAAYTLVEMMITVTIIGILAAVALPSYQWYSRRSKTAEVPEHLATMFKAGSAYFAETRTVNNAGGIAYVHKCAVGNSTRIPANPGPDPVKADFSADANFLSLHFTIANPIRFGYSIDGLGVCNIGYNTSIYTFRAEGDLDGDGVLSNYELAVGVNGRGELYRSPNLFVENETE